MPNPIPTDLTRRITPPTPALPSLNWCARVSPLSPDDAMTCDYIIDRLLPEMPPEWSWGFSPPLAHPLPGDVPRGRQ